MFSNTLPPTIEYIKSETAHLLADLGEERLSTTVQFCGPGHRCNRAGYCPYCKWVRHVKARKQLSDTLRLRGDTARYITATIRPSHGDVDLDDLRDSAKSFASGSAKRLASLPGVQGLSLVLESITTVIAGLSVLGFENLHGHLLLAVDPARRDFTLDLLHEEADGSELHVSHSSRASYQSAQNWTHYMHKTDPDTFASKYWLPRLEDGSSFLARAQALTGIHQTKTSGSLKHSAHSVRPTHEPGEATAA